MSNSVLAMGDRNQGSDVRSALSGEALSLGLNLGLATESQDGAKTVGPVGGPSLVDILGPNPTPQGSGNSSHATGNSNATPGSALNDTGRNQLHSGSPAQNNNGIPQRYGVMHQISGSPELGTGNSTNTSVQICQRMDEVSARMIAMEEMFNKLYYKINEQENTIQHLRVQSEGLLTSILNEVRQVNQNMPILDNPDDNEKDGFVTDLLNSITNVSSSYLKKVNTRHTQKYKRQRESMAGGESSANAGNRTNGTTNAANATAVNGAPSSKADLNSENARRAISDDDLANDAVSAQNSQVPRSQAPPNEQQFQMPASTGQPPLAPYLTQSSFTLNPNGIKRRRANTATKATADQGHQDHLSSLNSIGSMSLPNLTLDNLVRKGPANVLAFNSNLEHPSQNSTKPSRHRNIDIQIGSDHIEPHGLNFDSSEDEDGYQEDDEGHNNSDWSAAPPGASRRYSSRYDALNAAEEAEDENESYGDLFEPRLHSSSRHHPHKRGDRRPKAHSGTHVTRRADHQPLQREQRPQESTATTAATSGAVFAGSRRNCQRERELNYRLLKAPANVRAIWQEYVDGIDGQPAVKYLEETYGNKWRLKKNVKTFARRKRLYKFITNGIERGRSAEDMIDLLENKRIYKNEHGEVKKRTIGWLQQSLSGI